MRHSSVNRELRTEFAVGALVGLLFLGLAIFTIVISGKSFFQKNVFEMEAVLPDAMGLRRNDPVIAKGTTVGTVKDVFFATDGVHVSAILEAPVVFHEGYSVKVVSTSILGGRQLVLFEGNPEKPIVPDPKKLIGEKPADFMEDAGAAVGKLREFLDGNALDDFSSFAANLKVLGARLENGEGTLGKLLSTDDELYTNLNATVSNLRSITDRLEAGEGTLGRLLSSDDEIYTNLNATVANLRSITDRLEAGEGTLGKLLSSDDEIYTNLNATVANLRSITDRLEAGEGTLGKLLSSDEQMYDNINGAVTDVRELMDDMREANTLSTFTSLLFSGF